VVVALALVAVVTVLGTVRARSLASNTDAATADLRAKWRTLDLQDLADAYSEATFKEDRTGDYSGSIRLFPTARHATFTKAQFLKPGEIQANYSVGGWAGARQCLSVMAKGPTPNTVTVTHDGVGC
jgi:hypothetical protein